MKTGSRSALPKPSSVPCRMRRIPIDTRFANLAIFQFACCVNAIGGELDGTFFRKIGAARIAEQNRGAASCAIAEPGEQAFRERPLVAHVPDEDDVPAAGFADN